MRHDLLDYSWIVMGDTDPILYWDPSIGESERFAHLPVQSKEITLEQATNLIQSDKEKRLEIARLAAEKDAAQDRFDRYVAALPIKIGGLQRGHMDHPEELEDPYGNYCGSIPWVAAIENWPLDKLTSWIEQANQEEEEL